MRSTSLRPRAKHYNHERPHRARGGIFRSLSSGEFVNTLRAPHSWLATRTEIALTATASLGNRRSFRLSNGSASLGCASLLALAELLVSTPRVHAAPDDPTESIVVTAERRPRVLEELPGSTAQLWGSELDASGIRSTFDLPMRAPGLVFSTTAALGQPYLRGVGSDILSIRADSPVATFVDGVYRAPDPLVGPAWCSSSRVQKHGSADSLHRRRRVFGNPAAPDSRIERL